MVVIRLVADRLSVERLARRASGPSVASCYPFPEI